MPRFFPLKTVEPQLTNNIATSTNPEFAFISPVDKVVQTSIKSIEGGVDPAPGWLKVVGHSPSGRYIAGTEGRMNAGQIANWIRNLPNYSQGTPVCLVVCFGGFGENPLAQQLADELGTIVLGHTSMINAETLELLFEGTYKLFTPR